MTPRSIQDAIGHANGCWGCGPANPHGLQIKSYWEGDGAVCRFTPAPWHSAGPPDFVNGGILATVVDCHGVCTAIAARYRAEQREIGSDPWLWCVTGALELKYLHPTPQGKELLLRGRLLEQSSRKLVVACSVSANGVDTVQGKVVAIAVPQTWGRRGGS